VRRFFLFFLSCCVFSPVTAQRLPLWELGLAVGYAKVPYYRGASSGRDIILPLPLAIYRGKKYSVDDDGGHRWLMRSERFSLDLSLAAGLPVPKNDKTSARAGMPSLDATLELGPRLNLLLWKNTRQKISFVLPFRFASSVAFFDMAYRGWIVSPFLMYSIENKGKNGWGFDVLAGPLYASRKYHDYFYSVSKSYENNNRTVYKAREGYSGSRVTLYIKKSYKRLWLSAFARYDRLSGSVFEDSPIVEQKEYLVGGFVIGWIFKKSPQTVYVEN